MNWNACAGLALLALCVCGAARAEPAEGLLKLIVWPGYAERGQTDLRYDWVTPFERETGCKVSVRVALNSDEMVNLMNQGGFDLVSASGNASLRLIFARKVAALDPARVPGWEQIEPRLRQGSGLQVAGATYGVPFVWGANMLLYDSRQFRQAPGWSAVFEPQTLADGQPSQGRVQMHRGPMAIAEAALYLMKQRPALGIVDPYELSPTQYAQVLALLRQQRNWVWQYWQDPEQQVHDFRQQTLALSTGWGYTARALQRQGISVRTVIPREGATGWVDSWMLHSQAAHPVCAYQWMAYALRPRVQAMVAEWYGANPANAQACALRGPAGESVCDDSQHKRFADLHFWRTPQANCASQPRCVPYATWAKDYARIVAGR